MKKLRLNYKILKYLIVSIFLIFNSLKSVIADEIIFKIKGNQFTDSDVILSLLKDIPQTINEEFSNEIIKTLNNSNLFSDVSVNINGSIITIIVKEFPNINKLYFDNNERLKDEDLELIAQDIELSNYNKPKINSFVNEIIKLYHSFGYNNVSIDFYEEYFQENNSVDLYFDINEGSITKINKIIINGNQSISTHDISELLSSKTKSIRNILANNNYKPQNIEKDEYLIANYYRNNGFLDVQVKSQIEFLETNKVNLYFTITEGYQYFLSKIIFNDENNIIDELTNDLVNDKINVFLNKNKFFSLENLKNLKKEVSSIIMESGIEFFEIKSFEKIENNNVSIVFEAKPISPIYTNQINIIGNSRTFDYVIRRELEIVEGDAIYPSQIESIRDKLNSLRLFESVRISEEFVKENTVNLIIEVEEKQTGSFNAGVSVGTLDGFSIVTGLKERNFYGTGRSLDILANTSEDKNEFKLKTTDRLSYENDVDISYKINYKQQDFSKASSYKLDTFSSGIGIGYKINNNLFHNIDLEYVLKEYKITNSSTASNSIANSSGNNMSYLFKNNFRYSTVNPGFIARNGNYLNFNNTIETPTSSSNGFIRNLITLKQYYSIDKNIFSLQTKLGNIISLNNNDILTDDKFSLGGRWLRGFDNFGAGPRNSRTSYIGGNNIAVTKLDYSFEISNNSNFPIFLYLFNDYGLIWENKTTPTQSDNNLRASGGFGIKYYSPIGPIGFSWGFPLIDEEYDIKRMFLFSVGNID